MSEQPTLQERLANITETIEKIRRQLDQAIGYRVCLEELIAEETEDLNKEEEGENGATGRN